MKFFKLKFVTPICFLIFFMPFLRMCDKPVETVETSQVENLATKDSLSNKQIVDGTKSTDIPTYEIDGLAKDEWNLNAYQLGGSFFANIYEGKFESKDFFKSDFIPFFCYSLILIISTLMVIFSFLNKNNFVQKLTIVNVILLIISTIIFVKIQYVKKFSDLKYGFYVFTIYSLLLIFLARKENLDFKKL